MSEFRSLVERRLRELEARAKPLIARREELKSQIDKLNSELNSIFPEIQEINAAAKAIGIQAINFSEDQDIRQEGSSPSTMGGISIKQAIRLVLNSSYSGLNSSDILDRANKEFWDGNLDRTSFSPQLSRMKRDGEVDLIDGLYRITAHGRAAGNLPLLIRRRRRPRYEHIENEPSDVSASGGSDAGSDENLSD
ncbi:hypothetical protein [Methylobacterium dankookense]|uniref:hypothetical protein n=1 Tax=Methylobacterium dankookense TaxID=560405 RepID=UPI0011A4DF06|nr:hypothetical protein [Methylobacterium dankookense]